MNSPTTWAASIDDYRLVALFAEKSAKAFLEFCNTIDQKKP